MLVKILVFFFLLIDQFKFNSHRQHCLLMINIVCIESNCRKFKTGLIKKTEKNCDAKHRTNKLFQYCQKRKTYNKSLLYFFFSNYYYYLNCCHFTTNHCKFFAITIIIEIVVILQQIILNHLRYLQRIIVTIRSFFSQQWMKFLIKFDSISIKFLFYSKYQNSTLKKCYV